MSFPYWSRLKTYTAWSTKLVAIVPEYWPSPEIISLGAIDRHDQALNHQLARASLSPTQESAA